MATKTIDLEAAEWAHGPRIGLLQTKRITENGEGDEYIGSEDLGFDELGQLYVAAQISVATGTLDPELTLIVEHRDTEDDDWEEATSWVITTRGRTPIAVIEEPKARLRARWEVAGNNPRFVVAYLMVTPELAGSGGSVPIDDLIEFSETAGATPPLPIVDLDDATGTVVVAGDHTERFRRGAPFAISGSTGNDGNYIVNDVGSTYDEGNDQTTLTNASGVFPDATVDGDVQPPELYSKTIVLPADTFVEWVYAVTTAAWSADSNAQIYAGDEDAFDGWFQADTLDALDQAVQWPTITVDKNAGAGDYSLTRIHPKDDGSTVTIFILALDQGGSTGRTTVILHHHRYTPSTATKV